MTNRKTPETGKPTRSGENFAEDSLKDKIGGNLRQIYDDVVNEAVPDDFLALLADADDSKDD
ncbi:NepR family anti-sigma factor [Fretibacter rubidus]|uniref:NepR family anti-sigma factor n=1 Tax=Fretibacter rubidus TaxID=570162 RepID=UPI00352AD7BE